MSYIFFQHFRVDGGDEENRTPDPLLARQVLSQLSYTPIHLSGFPLLNVLFQEPSKLNNASNKSSLDPLTLDVWPKPLGLFRVSIERR